MNYINFSESIINQALKNGATSAETYIQAGKTLQIEISKGKIQKLQRASFRGIGLRIFIKGKVSFVSSSDFSQQSIDKLIEKGISFARESDAEKYNVLPEQKEKEDFEDLDIYDKKIETIQRWY